MDRHKLNKRLSFNKRAFCSCFNFVVSFVVGSGVCFPSGHLPGRIRGWFLRLSLLLNSGRASRDAIPKRDPASPHPLLFGLIFSCLHLLIFSLLTYNLQSTKYTNSNKLIKIMTIKISVIKYIFF